MKNLIKNLPYTFQIKWFLELRIILMFLQLILQRFFPPFTLIFLQYCLFSHFPLTLHSFKHFNFHTPLHSSLLLFLIFPSPNFHPVFLSFHPQNFLHIIFPHYLLFCLTFIHFFLTFAFLRYLKQIIRPNTFLLLIFFIHQFLLFLVPFKLLNIWKIHFFPLSLIFQYFFSFLLMILQLTLLYLKILSFFSFIRLLFTIFKIPHDCFQDIILMNFSSSIVPFPFSLPPNQNLHLSDIEFSRFFHTAVYQGFFIIFHCILHQWTK